jgi:phosphoserine phosphatase
MLELVDALRAAGVTVALVTGGGTEYVRAVSPGLYGVPPELVVGTRIRYRLVEEDGAPTLRRTAAVEGEVNEGAAKVAAIQAQLGRAPLLAAGNSPGDRSMLEYAAARPGGLALVVDHDDADREVAYQPTAASFAAEEPLVDTARRRGWVVVSMRDDWSEIWS